MWIKYRISNPYINGLSEPRFFESSRLDQQNALSDLAAFAFKQGDIKHIEFIERPDDWYCQLVIDDTEQSIEILQRKIDRFKGFLDGK